MNEKTLTEMSDSEFDELLERFIERGEDKIAPATFLQTVSELEERPDSALSLTREEMRRRMAEAARIAAPWYLEDKELTIFTALDGDDILEY